MTDEEFYGRVRACGLKPTAVQTVWQTLDEQERIYVPLPSTKDDDEKEIFLQQLWEGMRAWRES